MSNTANTEFNENNTTQEEGAPTANTGTNNTPPNTTESQITLNTEFYQNNSGVQRETNVAEMNTFCLIWQGADPVFPSKNTIFLSKWFGSEFVEGTSSKYDVKIHFQEGKFLFQSNQRGTSIFCKEKELYFYPETDPFPLECVSFCVFFTFHKTRRQD